MSTPFYVAPEQVMKDRADYARKGIARGRALVAVRYADGIALVSENPSNTLRKISEIYDRIAFAGVVSCENHMVPPSRAPFSMSVTLAPRVAATRAASIPPGPPPITTTCIARLIGASTATFSLHNAGLTAHFGFPSKKFCSTHT